MFVVNCPADGEPEGAGFAVESDFPEIGRFFRSSPDVELRLNTRSSVFSVYGEVSPRFASSLESPLMPVSQWSRDFGFYTFGICLCWLVAVLAGLAVAMHFDTERGLSADRSSTAWFVAVGEK